MAADTKTPDIRFVVVHTPGPKWVRGVDFREQPGVMDHVAHYRKLFEQGRLELGGPFTATDGGGMMIPTAGTTKDEIEAFAAADPSIKSGLLRYEVRPWYVAMKK